MPNQKDLNPVKSLISVLLPVYNAEDYLGEAIQSILTQSEENFDLLVLNDGSTDNSMSIVKEFKDDRIRVIQNEKNQGLIKTLNRGIKEAKGKFIARMDADDIALPHRLEKQLQRFKANSDLVVVGSNCQIFGNEATITDLPLTDEEIRVFMTFENPMTHPTVMIKASVLIENGIEYYTEDLHMEDWGLWYKLIEKGKFENISEPLLKYRVEGQNISIKNYKTYKERFERFLSHYLSGLLPVGVFNSDLHFCLSLGNYNGESLDELKLYVDELRTILVTSGYKSELIDEQLSARLQRLFYSVSDYSKKKGLEYLRKFRKYDLSGFSYLLRS